MSFEVPPSPVHATRMRWPALVFAVGLIVVVAAGVATQPPAPAPTPSAVALAATPTSTRPVGLLVTPSAAPRTATPRTLPSQVDCRQLDTSTCRGMAQAALDVLPGDAPPVSKVTVYRSLLCRDDLDCPPARLASSGAPSGSVVIGFADEGPDAWVDVVTRAASPAPGATATPAALEAWIIR
jgi:hypothetical protein